MNWSSLKNVIDGRHEGVKLPKKCMDLFITLFVSYSKFIVQFQYFPNSLKIPKVKTNIF